MVPFSNFYPYVTPHVSGVPEPYMDQCIRSACIEFCAQSMLIQDIDYQDIIADQPDYDITLPSQMTVAKVLDVMYGDAWVQGVTTESVRSGLATRGAVDSGTPASGTPSVYYMKDPSAPTISLYAVPDRDIAGGLTIRTAFVPARVSTQVSDVLFEDWAEEIGAGAVFRAMMTPGQSFTNTSTAKLFASGFYAGIRSAAIMARTGQIKAASRVQPARFIA